MSTGMACRPFRAAVCTETNIVFSAKGMFYKLRNKERSKESAFTFNQILRLPLKTNGHVAEADTPVFSGLNIQIEFIHFRHVALNNFALTVHHHGGGDIAQTERADQRRIEGLTVTDDGIVHINLL